MLLDDFRKAHARIDAELVAADAAARDTAQLLARLKAMRRLVVAHFLEKDAFYVALAEQCAAANDVQAAQLTRIFEPNMRMQSAAVVRFFEHLDTATLDTLASGYRTMATIIRQRFATEERAVFPLFMRTAPKRDEARP